MLIVVVNTITMSDVCGVCAAATDAYVEWEKLGGLGVAPVRLSGGCASSGKCSLLGMAAGREFIRGALRLSSCLWTSQPL